MTYGLGSTSARGTGTSGYIQRNLSQLPRQRSQQSAPPVAPQVREPNPEILLHNQKRQIEIECIKLRDLLEDQNVPEAEIDQKVADLRNSLTQRTNSLPNDDFIDSHSSALLDNQPANSMKSC